MIRSSDPFKKCERFLAKTKHLVFEIAIFVGFIAWIWSKVKHDLGF